MVADSLARLGRRVKNLNLTRRVGNTLVRPWAAKKQVVADAK